MWTNRMKTLTSSLAVVTMVWIATLFPLPKSNAQATEQLVNPIHKQMVRDVKTVTEFFEPFVSEDTATFYARLVVKYAYNKQLPSALVAGIIMQESAVNHTAVSVAGAQGLMQIIPSWWIGVYPECGNDLFDPETNICYGTEIFRFFLDEANGNRAEALARYSGQAKNYSQRVMAYAGFVCTL
jgi:soluble lytic murein transglycosylase-like protein